MNPGSRTDIIRHLDGKVGWALTSGLKEAWAPSCRVKRYFFFFFFFGLVSFLFVFFRDGGFLCVALAVLELTL
ncbi:mCG147508 [Mus musculus]|nr:mCG147508 [Mus musculus]